MTLPPARQAELSSLGQLLIHSEIKLRQDGTLRVFFPLKTRFFALETTHLISF